MSENNSKKELKVGLRRRYLLLGSTSLVAASALASTALPRAADAATPDALPEPDRPFKGKMGAR